MPWGVTAFSLNIRILLLGVSNSMRSSVWLTLSIPLIYFVIIYWFSLWRLTYLYRLVTFPGLYSWSFLFSSWFIILSELLFSRSNDCSSLSHESASHSTALIRRGKSRKELLLLGHDVIYTQPNRNNTKDDQ